MIVNIKGRNIEFDDKICELNKLIFGCELNDKMVIAHINSITVSDKNIVFEKLTDKQVSDIVSNCILETYKILTTNR